MTTHRGMSGCLRQAIVDAKLEHKLSTSCFSTLYNNKQGSNKRYFKWQAALEKPLSPVEQKRYLTALDKLLSEFDLVRTHKSFGYGIHIWCDIGDSAKVDSLKVKAKALGYRLVKLPTGK